MPPRTAVLPEPSGVQAKLKRGMSRCCGLYRPRLTAMGRDCTAGELALGTFPT